MPGSGCSPENYTFIFSNHMFENMKTNVKIIVMSLPAVLFLWSGNPDILPRGWEKWENHPYGYPDNYRIGIDNQISQHGHKSAFIESIHNDPDGYCTLTQICSEKNFKGERVKMTGYIKSDGLTDKALMWIRVIDIDKKISTDFDNMSERPVAGIKDWLKCEIIFDVPASKCGIYYGILLKGAGKIWFDNISFKIVDRSISKTAINLNAGVANIPRKIPEIPVNLDFEE
jgi:hypothetical protein